MKDRDLPKSQSSGKATWHTKLSLGACLFNVVEQGGWVQKGVWRALGRPEVLAYS